MDNNNLPIFGHWCLSTSDQKNINGNLDLAKRQLALMDSFHLVDESRISSGKRFSRICQDQTILGVSVDGKQYTLEFFDIHTWSMVFPQGKKYDTFALGNIYINKHFGRPDDIRFLRFKIKIPYLFEWFCKSCISISISASPDTYFTVAAQKAKRVVLYDGEDFTIYCEPEVYFPPLPGIMKKITIKQDVVVLFDMKNGGSTFDEAYKYIRHLERFFSLAVGREIRSTYFSGYMDINDREVVIIPYRARHEETLENENIHCTEMSFTFRAIEDNPNRVLSKWFESYKKCEDIYDLYSVIISPTERNINNLFRNLIGSIEGYIKGVHGKSDAQLDCALKFINNRIENKDQRILKGNDIKRIGATRNKLSHVLLKESDKEFIFDTEEIIEYYDKLKKLLEYNFMRDAGIADELVGKFLMAAI